MPRFGMMNASSKQQRIGVAPTNGNRVGVPLSVGSKSDGLKPLVKQKVVQPSIRLNNTPMTASFEKMAL